MTTLFYQYTQRIVRAFIMRFDLQTNPQNTAPYSAACTRRETNPQEMSTSFSEWRERHSAEQVSSGMTSLAVVRDLRRHMVLVVALRHDVIEYSAPRHCIAYRSS